mgnify:CR=1 FL=1
MNLNLTLILQVISFLILTGLLAKLLYKPFVEMLEKRQKMISTSVDDAGKSREEAKRYAEQTHRALTLAKQEALKIKEMARQEADEMKKEMFGKTRQESASMLEDAKKQIQKDTQHASRELKKEAANLAIEIAKNILAREIDEEEHKKIIDDSIREIEKSGQP